MKSNFIKRASALVSAAFIMAAVTAAGAFSAYAAEATPEDKEVTTFSDGTLTYSVIDDSRFVEVSACAANTSFANILPKIDGYTVVSIGDGAFQGCKNLQSVTFPMNGEITSVGAYAFAECESLTSVTLPDTITEIPIGMFAYCKSLEEVSFGKNVSVIGDEAFRECSSLKTIDIPDTVTEMDNFIFYMCTSLESVEIPESLETIGGYNFSGCVNMKSFNIPATLKDIGDAPFLGCMGLEEITVDEKNPSYTVNDGVLYSKDGEILYFYPPAKSETSFTVPDGVKIIYDAAFFQCTNLVEVIFPDGLLSIGGGAFDFCTSLDYVTFPESVTNIMSTAFADCSSLKTVTFTGADNQDGGEGDALTIGDHAFFVCENLKEVVLPSRTASIGEYAFGVTEMTDDSGNAIPTAVSDFMLRGDSAAESYISNCDVSVGFSPRSFPWKKVVIWVCGAAVVIVVLFFAFRIIKKNIMTPEEKEALRKAKEEREKQSQAEAEENASEDDDEGYESILGDDDEEDETEDEEEASRREMESFRGGQASPFRMHHIGHGTEDTEDTEE